MAGITLAQAETKLTEAISAYEKALDADSYSKGDRSVSRDLSKRQDAITFWENKVKSLDRGGIRVRGATPLW